MKGLDSGCEPFRANTRYTMRTISLVAREGQKFQLGSEEPNFSNKLIVCSVFYLEKERIFVQMPITVLSADIHCYDVS